MSAITRRIPLRVFIYCRYSNVWFGYLRRMLTYCSLKPERNSICFQDMFMYCRVCLVWGYTSWLWVASRSVRRNNYPPLTILHSANDPLPAKWRRYTRSISAPFFILGVMIYSTYNILVHFAINCWRAMGTSETWISTVNRLSEM